MGAAGPIFERPGVCTDGRRVAERVRIPGAQGVPERGLSRRGFNAAAAGLTAAAALPTTVRAAARAAARPGEGLDPAALEAISADLDGRVAAGRLPGYVALVARGDQVWTAVGGVRSLETGAPMTRDTIFAVASIGKPLTAVAALSLVEEGVLSLDGPVDPWLPELADRRVVRSLAGPIDDTVPADRPITLRDLLTMGFGLGAVFADPSTSPLLQAFNDLELAPGPRLFGHSADEYMRRLGTLPLMHQPGARWLYHTGLDVAGVLIARAAGTSLGEVLWRRVCAPLGMVDTGFFVPADAAHRLATAYSYDPETGAPAIWNPASGTGFDVPPAFEAGGGGQVSTVDDYLAFGRMLLGGGALGDTRILSPESVAEMTADQITPAQKAASPFFPGFWDSNHWGLGIAVVTAPDAVSDRPGRFGWWGGYGTTFFVDPATETVAVLFTQKMMSGADDFAVGETFLKWALKPAP